MLAKTRYLLSNSVGGGAIIIAIFSILSRLIGLFRDRLLTANFGAGEILDAYYAAFRLPDLVFNTLVLGALSSAFIPIFLEVYSKNKEEAWSVANSVLNILFVIILIFVIVFFIFAPILVNLIVPGFNKETKNLTIQLTRIMLIGILFFTLSNVVSSILNSFRRFFAYSLAPVMYNLGIIFGILFFVPRVGPIGLAWGVVFGSFLHFLSQLPSLFHSGYHWQPNFDWLNPAVRKIGFLMLPRCFGLAISQFNLIVTTLIASTLISGTIAIYNLAFNLVSFPINIFGTSLAVAVFPVFSKSLVDGQKDLFIHHFSKTIRRILYLIIPTSVVLILLRAQIVRLILGVGKFDWQDTFLTAQALGYFSISLFAQSLIPVLARAFYAKKDTITPVKAAVVGLIVNIVGCLILGPKMGVAGLALALSFSSIINLLLLFIILKKQVGNLDEKRILRSTLKIVCLSFLMALAIQFVKYQIVSLVNMQTFLGVLIQFLVASLIGGIFYFILSLIFEYEEVWIIKRYLKF
jgi:putative peptidoglycan lipid II flippase